MNIPSRTLELTDLRTAKPYATLNVGKNAWAEILSFSPDGSMLAYQKDYGSRITVSLLDVATKKERLFTGPEVGIKSIMFSPDNKALAAAAEDGLYLWNIAEAQEQTVIKEPIHGMAFSSDSKILAVCYGRLGLISQLPSTHVMLWDVAERKQRLTFEETAAAVSFTPDDKFLLTVHWDLFQFDYTQQPASSVKLWNATSGKQIVSYKVPADFGARSLVINPDGRIVAVEGTTFGRLITLGHTTGHSVRQQNEIVLIDSDSGNELAVLANVIRPKFSADGKTLGTQFAPSTLLVGTLESEMQIWDVPPRKSLPVFLACATAPTLLICVGTWLLCRRLRRARKLQRLRGSAEAKLQLKVVLETLQGRRTVPEACRILLMEDQEFEALRECAKQEIMKAREGNP